MPCGTISGYRSTFVYSLSSQPSGYRSSHYASTMKGPIMGGYWTLAPSKGAAAMRDRQWTSRLRRLHRRLVRRPDRFRWIDICLLLGTAICPGARRRRLRPRLALQPAGAVRRAEVPAEVGGMRRQKISCSVSSDSRPSDVAGRENDPGNTGRFDRRMSRRC